jgi:hypothetical protein
LAVETVPEWYIVQPITEIILGDIVYLTMVAILAGFRQGFVYEMLTRALRDGLFNRGDKRQQ